MSPIDQTVDESLEAIRANCPRLLSALQQSPEAVWGEIMRTEAACQALEQARSERGPDKAIGASEITRLVRALRVQMTGDGLVGYEGFTTFRQAVSAIESCANRLRHSLAEARSPRRLKVCVFYCSNNLEAGWPADLGEERVELKAIGLPCSGKVDVPYLVKALETGADGVVIVACRKKECRHFEGSPRAHKRAEAVESLLEEIGLGAGRMKVVECARGGTGRVREEIKKFIERVGDLPQRANSSEATNKVELRAA